MALRRPLRGRGGGAEDQNVLQITFLGGGVGQGLKIFPLTYPTEREEKKNAPDLEKDTAKDWQEGVAKGRL